VDEAVPIELAVAPGAAKSFTLTVASHDLPLSVAHPSLAQPAAEPRPSEHLPVLYDKYDLKKRAISPAAAGRNAAPLTHYELRRLQRPSIIPHGKAVHDPVDVGGARIQARRAEFRTVGRVREALRLQSERIALPVREARLPDDRAVEVVARIELQACRFAAVVFIVY
jgi:hypothetical protein